MRSDRSVVAQGGIVAENIGLLALYCESTMKAGLYENRALLKCRYENAVPIGVCVCVCGGGVLCVCTVTLRMSRACAQVGWCSADCVQKGGWGGVCLCVTLISCL